MTRMIIAAAALATFATAASANSSEVIVQAVPTAHVSFGDLNLHSSSGRMRLAGRIRSAASSLCTEDNVEPLAVRLEQINCYQVAVAGGLDQMDEIAAR